MWFLDGYFDCSRVKFRARARRSDWTILRTLSKRRLLVRGGCRRSLAESPTHRDLAGPLFIGNLSCLTCANRQHNLFLRSSEREPGGPRSTAPVRVDRRRSGNCGYSLSQISLRFAVIRTASYP